MGMKPSQYMEYLKKQMTINPNQSVFVMGKVGVGKSQTTKAVADDLGWEFRDIRLALLNPVDLRGLPDIDKEKRETYWTKPVFLPPEDYDKDIVLFFDEFNTSDSDVQKASLQLLLDRQIGEYKLPPKARVVCGGNGLEDGAFVTKLSSATQNRVILIDFETDFDDWKKWSFKNKMNPLVIAFHNWRKGELLHNYNKNMSGKPFATPRSWAFVGLPKGILDLGLENGTLYEALKGALGEGVATEFYGFLKIYRDLPRVEDILVDKKDIVPKESNVMYALIGALINATREKKEYLDRLIQYAMKISEEFSVVLMKDLLKTELQKDILDNKSFDVWAKKYEDVIL